MTYPTRQRSPREPVDWSAVRCVLCGMLCGGGAMTCEGPAHALCVDTYRAGRCGLCAAPLGTHHRQTCTRWGPVVPSECPGCIERALLQVVAKIAQPGGIPDLVFFDGEWHCRHARPTTGCRACAPEPREEDAG